MTNYLLWALYVCAVLIQATFELTKFVLVHSIVCSILIMNAVKSIDWAEINAFRNQVGRHFVYA